MNGISIDAWIKYRRDHIDTVESTPEDHMLDDMTVFQYLNRLRESGVTNMFGAAPYVQDEFGVSATEARGYVARWMRWVDTDPSNLEK